MKWPIFSATCKFDGCTRPKQYFNGLCAGHNRQQQRGKPLRPLNPRMGRPTLVKLAKDDADRWIAEIRARKAAAK